MAKLVFNILAIAGAAGFSGVMLCIGVTLGGFWRSLPPELFLEWFAQNNQLIARAVSIIFLPTFIGAIGSVWLSLRTPAFIYWALSGLCIVIVIILTIGYFVPTNNLFASNAIETTSVQAKLNQWLLIHNARIICAMISAILGVVAISQNPNG